MCITCIILTLLFYQALYHALPMKYVTVAKLQSKLDGEANQTTLRKIIDKMTRDGFVEAKGTRRLGESCRNHLKNVLRI